MAGGCVWCADSFCADPEGILSIEAQLADGTMPEPIQTIVRDARLDAPMKFALQPGVEVAFTGDVHLHGYVMHSFAGRCSRDELSFLLLTARHAQTIAG